MSAERGSGPKAQQAAPEGPRDDANRVAFLESVIDGECRSCGSGRRSERLYMQPGDGLCATDEDRCTDAWHDGASNIPAAPEGQEAPRVSDEWPTTHADKEAAAFRALNAAAPEVPSARPAIEFAQRPTSGFPVATHRCSDCRTGWHFLPDGAGVHRTRLEAGRHPLPHSLAEDDETPCANPRPAHPPAARVEREICKEDGCPLATDADLKRALGPADKEWADSLCWVNVGCRHRDPKPVSAAPVDPNSAPRVEPEKLGEDACLVCGLPRSPGAPDTNYCRRLWVGAPSWQAQMDAECYRRGYERLKRAAVSTKGEVDALRAENARLVKAVQNFLMMDDSPVYTLTERNEDGSDEVQYFCLECNRNEKTGEHEPECATGVLLALLPESDKQTILQPTALRAAPAPSTVATKGD